MSKPAARLGDMTAHGGTIVVGCPTVLIGGMPAARVGDMHVCPMMNPGPVPHVGGPVSLGSATVLIGGMPAARMGDMATCSGPPDTIAAGCPTVLIGDGTGSGGGGGGGAAQAASVAAHAALVGEPGPAAEGPHWIEYELVDTAGNPVVGQDYRFTHVQGNLENSITNTNGKVYRGALPEEGDCELQLITLGNAKWSSNECKLGDEVTLTADAIGYDDGVQASLSIWQADVQGADQVIFEQELQVQGEAIETSWCYEMPDEDDEHRLIAPRYYFLVDIEGRRARSGDLRITHDIDLKLRDADDNPLADTPFLIIFDSGQVIDGKTDGSGNKTVENVTIGAWDVELPEYQQPFDKDEG